MPVSRKHQFAAIIDGAGVAGTPTSANVIDTKTVEVGGSQAFQTRDPSGGTLSRSPEATGLEERSISVTVDAKGSGTPATPPDWGPLAQAALLAEGDIAELTLDGTGALVAIYPGDVLTGASSGAVLYVMNYVAAGAAAAKIYGWKPTATTFTAGEDLDSENHGDAVAVLAASSHEDVDFGVSYSPVSNQTITFTAAASSWTGTAPVAGEGIIVEDISGSNTSPVGGLIYVALNSTTVTARLVWGTVPGDARLTATEGGTLLVASSPALALSQAPTVSALSNRDTLKRPIQFCRTTMTLTANAGETGEMSFTLSGQPGSESNADPFTGFTLPATTPPRWAGGYFCIDGARIPTKSMTLDTGNSVANILDANSTNGLKGSDVTDRLPTIQAEIEQTSLADFDLYELRRNSQTVHIGALIGSVAGNRLGVAAPRAQITEIQDGEQDGIATHTVTFALRIFGDGDDEYAIGHF